MKTKILELSSGKERNQGAIIWMQPKKQLMIIFENKALTLDFEETPIGITTLGLDRQDGSTGYYEMKFRKVEK